MSPGVLYLLRSTGRKIRVIHVISDPLGVSDSYLDRYCNSRGMEIPKDESLRRFYKKEIRIAETLGYYNTIGVKVDSLRIDWPLIKADERINKHGQAFINAHHSIFDFQSSRSGDIIKINFLASECEETINILYPPFAGHPHHTTASKLILQALKTFSVPSSNIFFMRSPQDRESEPADISRTVVFSIPGKVYDLNGGLISQYFKSQDERHEIDYGGMGFYAHYSEAYARNTFQAYFPENQEVGHAEDLIQLRSLI
jgi:hypothetical protein